MLVVGSTAPEIDLEDPAGRPVRLADYHHKSSVLLYFMRSTSCPVCNSHAKDLMRRHDEFAAAGVQVMVAVPEGRSEAAKWQAKRLPPFPVVTGRRGTAHEAIGLARKVFGTLQQSGSVLIDQAGVVRHAHAATMPTNSYDKKDIDSAIKNLPARAAR